MQRPPKFLGVTSLALLTVAAIVSLRNLPLMAVLGWSSILYLIAAVLIFFVPVALVTAELAAAIPKSGGCYTWISTAFNKPLGFFTLWIAWMESIAWFPAILAFSATMFAKIFISFFPGLEDNNIFITIMITAIFWGITLINFLGINVSSIFSNLGVIVGTIVPGISIIILGLWWILSGQKLVVQFNTENFLPDFKINSLVIFCGVLLSLAGAELSAFHINDTKNPQSSFPKALILASFFIVLIYIFGTISIVAVVPEQELSLTGGIVQAFNHFFANFNIQWVTTILTVCLFLGSISGINAWIIGPAKGLLVVAEDGFLPEILASTNLKQAPCALLILQAIIGSVLSLVFLYLDDTNAAVWSLTAVTAQFTFVQYIIVFLAAIKLRYFGDKLQYSFKTPALWLVSFIGILVCAIGFFVLYVPPNYFTNGAETFYRAALIITFVILIIPPIMFIIRKPQPRQEYAK